MVQVRASRERSCPMRRPLRNRIAHGMAIKPENGSLGPIVHVDRILYCTIMDNYCTVSLSPSYSMTKAAHCSETRWRAILPARLHKLFYNFDFLDQS